MKNSSMSNPFLFVNFKIFDKLMSELGNIDDVIMYSALAYQCSANKPERSGHVIRTGKQLAKYISCEEKKVGKVLKRLSDKGYINSKVGVRNGEKKHIVSAKFGEPAVHFGKLAALTKYTQCNKLSVLMSYIVYAKDESGWCKLHSNKIKELLSLPERACQRFVKTLLNSEFFEANLSGRYHNRQIEIKIEDSFSSIICTKTDEIDPDKKGVSPDILVVSPDKKGVSPDKKGFCSLLVYNNRLTISKINSKGEVDLSSTQNEQSSDSIVICLSDDDKKYLMGALRNTFDKMDCEYVNKDSVTEQILFSLTRRSSEAGTQSFKHAVNMRMKMLRDAT